ncbi:MAG: RHS repeat-associated core domain-containing protein [Phycicoccus sp.]
MGTTMGRYDSRAVTTRRPWWRQVAVVGLCAALSAGAAQPAVGASQRPFENAAEAADPADATPAPRVTKRAAPRSVTAPAPTPQLVEQFTPTSRSRQLANGTTRVEQYNHVRFARTAAGWRELSGRLSDGRGAVAAKAESMAYPVWFGNDPRRNLMQIRLPNAAPTLSLPSAKLVAPRVTKGSTMSTITYPGVAADTDLTYAVSGSRVEKALVLRSAKAPTSFTFHLDDQGGRLGRPTRTATGGYLFDRDLGDQLHLELGRASAWEQGSAPGQETSASQTVTKVKGGYDITLALDPAWMTGKTYPIVLDPTIQYTWPEGTLATASADAYGPDGSACGESACPLTVGTGGSIFVGPGHYGYLRADLSNFPTALPISSAAVTFTEEIDYAFDGSTMMLVPVPAGEPDPVDGPDLQRISETQCGAGVPGAPSEATSRPDGGLLWSADVRDPVTNWVRAGQGDKVRFVAVRSWWCAGSALAAGRGGAAARAAADLPDPTWQGWVHDLKLTIDYQGRPLPPPIPIEQTFGCDCRWVHGAGVVGQRLDPVNTAAGAQIETDTDIPAAAAPGIPLDLTRTFNGLDTRAGPLGAGWTHGFDAALQVDSATGNITFRDATGGRSLYVKQVDGSYLGNPGVTATLTGNPTSGWTLTALSGETLTFDAAGRPVSDLDQGGKGVSYTYAGGRLTRVTDSLGRYLSFTYGTSGAANGRVTTVATDDGRQVRYQYTTIAGAPRLTKVLDLHGVATTITYATNGTLTGIRDGNGKTAARNVYDAVTGRVIRQTDPAGRTSTLAWDANTQTQTITDPSGAVTKDVYHGNVLIRHVAADGGQSAYYYDDNLNLVSVVDPRGNATTMTYDNAGNLLTRTAPAPFNTRESWAYDSGNRPIRHVDPTGFETTYSYTPEGRLDTVSDIDGSTRSEYNTAGQLTATIDRAGKRTTYGYNAAGDQTSITDPLGHTTTMGYDAAHRMTSRTDPRGNVPGCSCSATYTTRYTHDGAGRVLTETDPLGRVTTHTYDPVGNRRTTTDPAGASTSYTYTANNQVATVTDALGRVTTNGYDSTSRLVSVTDPLARKTTYTYDPAGRMKTTRTPAGNAAGVTAAVRAAHTTTFGYDLAGNQTSVSVPSPGGGTITTSTVYDQQNRPTAVTDPTGGVTRYSYDAAGRVSSTTDPVGGVTERTYDSAGRVSSELSPAGVPTSYLYDARGSVTERTVGSPWTDTSASVTTHSYDAAGRLTSSTDPRGNVPGCDCAADYTTRYTYDPAGNQTAVTDPLGHTRTTTVDAANQRVATTDANQRTTTYTYDPAGRATTVRTPGGRTTTYTYDAIGNIQRRTDPRGNDTVYGYDAANQLTSTTTPGGRQTTAGYDLNGNRTTVTTPAGNATTTAGDGTITHAYDPLRRMTATSYSDGTPTITVGYDKASRLVTLTDALSATRGNQTRTYDPAGRLTTLTRGSEKFTYTYDTARLTATAYPDGRTTTYGYDELGRVATQSWPGHTVSHGYDPAGQLTSQRRDNALTTTWSYDRAARVTAATTTAGSGTTIASFSQQLDPAGNPTRASTTRATAQSTTYTHDADNQLTGACYADPCTAGSPSITYNYDESGNRTRTVRTGVPDPGTTTYTYDVDDQLTATTNATGQSVDTYTHDPNGNLTTVAGAHPASYTINLAGQLTTATTDSGTVQYRYDGTGNRATSTTTAGTTSYTWDHAGNPRLIAVDNPGAAPDEQYRHGPTGPLSVTAGTELAWQLQDLHHNTTDLLTTDGARAGSYTFDPFGQPLATTGTSALLTANRLRFASEAIDPTTGLSNNRARQYDPTTGRFTAVDPVPTAPGAAHTSAYVYVGNQPLLFTDPSGMCQWNWCYFAPQWGVLTGHAPEMWDTTKAMAIDYVRDPQAARDELAVGAVRSVTDTATFTATYNLPGGIGENAYNCYDTTVDGWERQAGLDPDSPWHDVGAAGLDLALLATGTSAAKLALRAGVAPAMARAEITTAQAAANTGSTALRGVDEILGSLSKGKQGFVRTVPDESSLNSTFAELTQGGSPTTWKNFSGKVIERGDGVQVGLRNYSKSGGSTIDIRMPDGSAYRIHVDQ